MWSKPKELETARILYVEDHEDTQIMIKTFLDRYGYTVVPNYSIAEGYASAKSGNFNLIMLDSWLPDGDGIDLCRQIRTFNNQTPIIFMSGAVFPADIQKALAAGAQAYLQKPIELTELYHTVFQLTQPVGAAM